jgi:hypothetical protein
VEWSGQSWSPPNSWTLIDRKAKFARKREFPFAVSRIWRKMVVVCVYPKATMMVVVVVQGVMKE